MFKERRMTAVTTANIANHRVTRPPGQCFGATMSEIVTYGTAVILEAI